MTDREEPVSLDVQTGGLLVLSLLCLDIWAAVSVVSSDRSPAVKASWIAVIVVLPILGLIAWIFAGPHEP